ncbi:MAG: hypothetical protein PHW11_05325 [Anaerolineaceae bacterium]|nr:hypothetical protein [Anaerolineaceae bacterium]MDD4042503.1 hypothetical protein [Anaerolineaceae bacterium]
MKIKYDYAPMKADKLIILFPFYVLLLGIYPVLFALGHNIHEVYASVALRPLLLFFGFSLALLLVFFLVTKDWIKAGLLSSYTLLLFFSYGKLLTFTKTLPWLLPLARHAVFIPLYAVIAIIVLYFIAKAKPSLQVQNVLTWFSIFLIAFPLFQIARYSIETARQQQQSRQASVETSFLNLPENPPDVYVIVLDSYPRADIVESVYQVDNSKFLGDLSALGFTTVPCSRSNYAYTELSLASMFNMDYLDVLAADVLAAGNDTLPLFNLLKHSQMRTNLEALGYTSYSIVSYPPLAWEDADVFISTEINDIPKGKSLGTLNSFERMVYYGTALRILLDSDLIFSNATSLPANYPYEEHLLQHQYTLDSLRSVAAQRGPKLVFSHITSPHAPFVFYPDGSLIENPPVLPWQGDLPHDEHIKYFGMQIEYIDSAIYPVLETILNESETEPIIILFGDHGYGSDEKRMPVLSSIYFSPNHRESIPKDLSLVNTFRLMFNLYFSGEYEILPNLSYMSPHSTPYQFTLMEEISPNCADLE